MTKEKCQRCRWPYGGFHICLDLPEEKLKRVEPQREGRRFGPMSENSKKSMSESAKSRWDREHAERNRQIVELYKAGSISTNGVAEKVGCSQATVIKILKRANVPMRKRGHTLAKGAV